MQGFVRLGVVLGLALSLAACGPGGSSDGGEEPPTAEVGGPGDTGEVAACDEATDELAYLNCLRGLAGLTDLARAPALDEAAQGHADYLVANGQRTHKENPGLEGFVAETPAKRAREADYDAFWDVAEVIAYRASERAALDSLMSALYHRLALLRLDAGEVGMATASGGREPEAAFVALTANPAMGENCDAAEDGSGGFTLTCDPGYQATRTRAMEDQPPWIPWPPPGAEGIPPAFFEENPDPLPDYSVSGYPVSLQFNPARVDEVTVNSLSLEEGGQPVAPIRRLEAGTDPHERLTPYQYAWFPLERLAWGTEYRVTAEVVVDGQLKELDWSFATRELPGPVHTWAPDHHRFAVTSGERVNVYLPPASQHQTGLRWEASRPAGANLDIQAVDQNTLAITFSGQAGDEATVTATLREPDSAGEERTFTLEIR